MSAKSRKWVLVTGTVFVLLTWPWAAPAKTIVCFRQSGPLTPAAPESCQCSGPGRPRGLAHPRVPWGRSRDRRPASACWILSRGCCSSKDAPAELPRSLLLCAARPVPGLPALRPRLCWESELSLMGRLPPGQHLPRGQQTGRHPFCPLEPQPSNQNEGKPPLIPCTLTFGVSPPGLDLLCLQRLYPGRQALPTGPAQTLLPLHTRPRALKGRPPRRGRSQPMGGAGRGFFYHK